jgi:hypothetical protein
LFNAAAASERTKLAYRLMQNHRVRLNASFVEGVYLRTADIITDEIGERYKLTSTSELN